MAAPMKKSMSAKKRKLEDLSVDEFMLHGLDSDGVSVSSSNEEDTKKEKQMVKKDKVKKKKKESSVVSHKKSLEKLKEQDPEFYKFLQQEDKDLLAFDDDGDEDNDDDDDDDDDDDLSQSDDDSDNDEIQEKEKQKKVKKKADKEKNIKNKAKTAEKLDFMESSSDDDDSSDDESEGKFHKLPEKLEVASDDSDDSGDSDTEMKPTKTKKQKRQGQLITNKMVKDWSKSIQQSPSPAVLKDVISAFKAAVKQTGSEGETTKYRVEGSAVFNAVVRLCLSEVPTALQKIVGLPPLTDLQKPSLPSKDNKKWRKIRLDVKSYLTDVLQMMTELSEPTMINVFLKQIHKLIAYYASFIKLAKVLLKKCISLWSTSEETTRVLAFLCINRLIRVMQSTLLEPCLKQMYMAYVKNCKFTSPTTLPLINFMQRSLVEIFAIDFVLAYQYSFIYIRQLAIHLRNAITVKKKETCQAVYNWQFVHCLGLWVRLLSATYPNEILEPLIYPLTETIIGTIKLVPTARYYPLRFHCCRALTILSEATNTFIPVLPFLLEVASVTFATRDWRITRKSWENNIIFPPTSELFPVLFKSRLFIGCGVTSTVFEQTDFNKRAKNISFKPFNFACILKLSKAQLQEKSFKDGIIDQLYELLLDHFHIHAHSVGFPELALPAVLQIKDFLKKCKVANFCKQIKQILDKVEETSKFITDRRKNANLTLSDSKAIETWERQCKEAGTPLNKYYTTWRKLRDRELQHQIAAKDQVVGDDGLPVIERRKGPVKATPKEKEEFSALFEGDSDESEDDETRFLPKSERPVKSKKAKTNDGSDSDDYSDFDSDELEQLARSASEDDDDEDDEVVDDDDDDDDDVENDSDDGDDVDKDDVVEDFTMSDSD